MICKINILRRIRIMAVVLAGIFLVPALRAQPLEPGRFLFIFETSSAMKNRVEAVQKALNAMLATSLHGQLHTGDSIGVWTFSQDLQTSGFPLQTWNADNAAKIAASLTKFVDGRRYAKTGRFEALQPLLNQVVQSSGRLTVIIFCDGTGKAAGTPLDAGINQAFQEKLGEQTKAHEPFIILLRSQQGKFTGCTLTFPPASLNIPEFPPLPAPPPPPAPKVTTLPPPVITNTVPSLFITGTRVSTNPLPPETNLPPANVPAPPPTNPPAPQAVVPTPVAVPVQPTNATVAPPTNPVVAKITTSTPTNVPAVVPALPPENSGSGGNKFLMVAAGLLGAAVVLGIVVRSSSHRKDSSLITRSMNDRR